MLEHGNALSRNPNICACCSSLADGMGESDLAEEVEAGSEATGDSVTSLPAAVLVERQLSR